MLKARDFRRYARESLRGRWLKAGGVGLLASLLGASIGTNFYNYVSGNSGSATGGSAGSTEILDSFYASSSIPAMFFAVVMGIALVFLLYTIVLLVIGGATTLGYAKYNLNLVDNKDSKLKDLFSQYNRLGTGFGMQFFRALFVFLWSLLLVIPGIIAGYRYYMTPFILCEHPEMTAREAITESKELMKGNKWRLFCLEFSFIGWELMATGVMLVVVMLIMTPMIFNGNAIMDSMGVALILILLVVLIAFVIVLGLTLSPYVTASIAVFYREISEGRYSDPHLEAEAGEYTYADVESVYEEAPVQDIIEE